MSSLVTNSELLSCGVSQEEVDKFCDNINKILSSNNKSSEKWREIYTNYLEPSQPFSINKYLFHQTYLNSEEPNYIWIPTISEIKETNIYKYMISQNQKNIFELFDWADKNREIFWQSIVKTLNLKFYKNENENENENENKNENENNIQIFDISKGIERPIYFPNTKMNAADWILNGLNNNNNNNFERIGIIWSKENELDSNNNLIINKISINELNQSVINIAYSLTNKLKLKPGDSIAIDMPMNWQSVAIYIAIIKAGMTVVSIADSFAPAAIEVRLKISNAKAIFTQDIIARGNKKIPLYERVIAANALKCIVISESNTNNRNNKLQCKLRDCDISWIDFLSGTSSSTQFSTILCDSMDIANILFSSGTTGEPKAIPWHHSTFIKPLCDGYLHNDIRINEVVSWPTNIGWMMGPWLITQMGLGSTIALFVGNPSTKLFCKFVELTNISHLGVIPSIVKHWMKINATKNCNWKCVRRYSSTGEASNPILYHWLISRAYYAPVMEYVGGTEIAGGYLGGTMVQPQLLSSFSMPCFGLNIHIINDMNNKIINNINCEGQLSISPPSCGLSVTLLNKDHYNVYYNDMPKDLCDQNGVKRPVLRRHGDQLRIIAKDEQYGTYYQHLGRVDDTMNLGGIKISSVALENVILKHPLLSREVAAISYRQNDIDQEELVVCCVPKSKDDLFEMTFNKKPFGIKLTPVKNNDKITIVYGIDDEQKESAEILLKQYEFLSEQPIIYKINNNIVYNKLSFDKVINIIQNGEISNDKPMIVSCLRQRFNPTDVQKEIQVLVKKELNPLFRVKDIYLINKLPRTASGKVMRRILRGNYSSSRKQ